jgi:hypothetical protein
MLEIFKQIFKQRCDCLLPDTQRPFTVIFITIGSLHTFLTSAMYIEVVSFTLDPINSSHRIVADLLLEKRKNPSPTSNRIRNFEAAKVRCWEGNIFRVKCPVN